MRTVGGRGVSPPSPVFMRENRQLERKWHTHSCKYFIINELDWRRERDSNPRAPFEANGFQDRRFQPLTHPSSPFLPIAYTNKSPFVIASGNTCGNICGMFLRPASGKFTLDLHCMSRCVVLVNELRSLLQGYHKWNWVCEPAARFQRQ